ncbi:MAG: hypothetical protein ACREBV_10730, partial [Candidatus Zixiibacteriota bacterium]
MLVLISKIESTGATALHIFAPNAAIFDRHELPVKVLREGTSECSILTPDELQSRDVSVKNENAKNAFLHLVKSVQSLREVSGQRYFQFKGCIKSFDLPEKESLFPQGEVSTSPVTLYNGQYMIGYAAVGIYLMESNGSQENWWLAAEQQTFNEIVEGLNWLSNEAFNRGVKVVWVYPPVEKVYTNYEPITGQSVPYYSFPNWVFNWLDDIYTSNGETDEWNGAYALANQLRKTYKTNWAVEIAVVMDQNDNDQTPHMFTDTMFAYAVTYNNNRSPIVIMTYNNDNWGPIDMDAVVSHEVSHTFGASDEEYDPPTYVAPTCNGPSSCGHQ